MTKNGSSEQPVSPVRVGGQWFLWREDRQHGPISRDELLRLAELGTLRDDDLLWRSVAS